MNARIWLNHLADKVLPVEPAHFDSRGKDWSSLLWGLPCVGALFFLIPDEVSYLARGLAEREFNWVRLLAGFELLLAWITSSYAVGRIIVSVSAWFWQHIPSTSLWQNLGPKLRGRLLRVRGL